MKINLTYLGDGCLNLLFTNFLFNYISSYHVFFVFLANNDKVLFDHTLNPVISSNNPFESGGG